MALFVALVLSVACAQAFADEGDFSQAFAGDYTLYARQDENGTISYALVGAGDGTEVLNALLDADARKLDYADMFSRLLETVTKFTPARTFVSSAPFDFTGRLDAQGDVNGQPVPNMDVRFTGETLGTLAGNRAFVFATGSLAGQFPTVLGDGFSVTLWTPEHILSFAADGQTVAPDETVVFETTVNANGQIGQARLYCPNCEALYLAGDAAHTASISRYCKEGHTKCMGDPEHYCDPDDGGCGRTYKCSHSNSHTKCIKCGRLWCDKKHGNHTEAPCGHRYCEIYGREEAHGKCPACGKYLCNGKGHTLAACGMHHKGEAGDHAAAPCAVKGHYNCDGKDHGACAHCGGRLCDGKDHTTQLACGHYACESGDHALAGCGQHYKCEEGFDAAEHAKAACGEHYICAGNYSADDHAAAGCGTAGHYNCDGKDHGACAHCGGRLCDGKDHTTQLACGHYACESGDHALAGCGQHYKCEEGFDAAEHAKAACGEHYICAGNYSADDHAAAGCGTAGHYSCDGKDHSPCPYHLPEDDPLSTEYSYCQGHLCDANVTHAACEFCGRCTAAGTHGEGICTPTGD